MENPSREFSWVPLGGPSEGAGAASRVGRPAPDLQVTSPGLQVTSPDLQVTSPGVQPAPPWSLGQAASPPAQGGREGDLPHGRGALDSAGSATLRPHPFPRGRATGRTWRLPRAEGVGLSRWPGRLRTLAGGLRGSPHPRRLSLHLDPVPSPSHCPVPALPSRGLSLASLPCRPRTHPSGLQPWRRATGAGFQVLSYVRVWSCPPRAGSSSSASHCPILHPTDPSDPGAGVARRGSTGWWPGEPPAQVGSRQQFPGAAWASAGGRNQDHREGEEAG